MDTTGFSNGNSFGNESMSASGRRTLETLPFRLIRANQDRGNI